MNYYVYNADVYCERCAQDIVAHLRQKAHCQHGYVEDSGDLPQGPFTNEESDTPQHCGSGEDCLDPTVLPSGIEVGKFLENPLTEDGRLYARTSHQKLDNEFTAL